MGRGPQCYTAVWFIWYLGGGGMAWGTWLGLAVDGANFDVVWLEELRDLSSERAAEQSECLTQ